MTLSKIILPLASVLILAGCSTPTAFFNAPDLKPDALVQMLERYVFLRKLLANTTSDADEDGLIVSYKNYV